MAIARAAAWTLDDNVRLRAINERPLEGGGLLTCESLAAVRGQLCLSTKGGTVICLGQSKLRAEKNYGRGASFIRVFRGGLTVSIVRFP